MHPSTPDLHRWPALPDTERRVLLELLVHGSLPRVRIAERLGLSRTSLSRITRGLIESGLITEGPSLALGGRGRPAESLHLRSDAAHFVGIKLTAETMYLVVTDLLAQPVLETSMALHSRDVGEVVALIASSIRSLGPDLADVAAVGIAVAGDVTSSPQGSILHQSNFLGWDAVALGPLVSEATSLHATVVNDVHALTGAHHWFGTDGSHRSLVVFGVGAGIGSGVVIDGTLHPGTHGRAGRVGHTRIGGRGRRCENGHVDCTHSFVTIPAIEHNAGVGAGEYTRALADARKGNDEALRAFHDAARALGAVVAESVNAFDPEVVAIMGEGVDMIDLAPEAMYAAMAEFLEQGDVAEVVVERPPFAFGLYARGAAVAAMREVLS
ncbi:ROK family transcriptional regulator [Ruania halotolerans]|uniref:ROK family transcriptional regulator n=1 Tax=Ruania halotolerans TaxID=2897773 RepID=UPI001E4C4A10|nr:ROK family transcriptional regulator [Ruania halotolerans]UFU05692.1 ROK family transcriptional regulator [Ruania halotolerans]